MTKNEIKANALNAAAESLLVGATIAAGLGMFHLASQANAQFGLVAAIVIAFAVHSMLAPMFTSAFGPAINRLRGTAPAKTTDTAPNS